MAKFSFTQNSLTAGEVSKSAWGESEQEHYTNGCEKLKNVMLSKNGVQEKRLGTINVTPIPALYEFSHPDNSPASYSKYARIFPFSYQTAGGVSKSFIVIVEPRELVWNWDDVDSRYEPEVNPEFHPDSGEDSRYGIKVLDVSSNVFSSVNVSDVKNWLTNNKAKAWSGFSLAELRNAKFVQIENNLILYSPNSIPCVINFDQVTSDVRLLTWWSAVSLRAIPVDKIDYTYGSNSTLSDKLKEGKGDSFYWLAQVYRDLYNDRTVTFTTTTVGAARAFSFSGTVPYPDLHPGDFLKINGTSATGYAVIETYNGVTGTGAATVLVATPASNNPFYVGILGLSNVPVYQGRGGSSGGADEFKYPLNSIVAFKNRIILGLGGLVAGSQIQSYGEFDFTGEASNDRPYVFRLLNTKPSYINWMIPGKSLRIGTGESEILASLPDSTLDLGAFNASFNPETYNGSANRQAIEHEGNVIFVGKDRKTPLVQYFNRDQSAYRIANLILNAEDIFKRSYEQGRDLEFDSTYNLASGLFSKTKRLIYTRREDLKFILGSFSNSSEIYEMALDTNNDRLWVVDSFGCLYSALLDGTSSSWSHHVLGGTRGDGEAPFVVSACVVPDSKFGSDSLFMLVERKINGNMMVTIEKLLNPASPPEAMPSFPSASDYPAEADEPFDGGPYSDWLLYNTYYVYPNLNKDNILYANAYMDGCVFLGADAPATKFGKIHWDNYSFSLSYLEHLEGETVQVFSEGFYVGDFVVTAGEITLPQAYPWIVVGLKYEAEIIPVPPQFGALDGNSEGHKRRIHAATVRFHRTQDAKMGPSGENVLPQEINFRPPGLNANEPTPFFNGLKQVSGFSDYGLEGSVRIVSDKPYPMGVVCVNFKGQVNEG